MKNADGVITTAKEEEEQWRKKEEREKMFLCEMAVLLHSRTAKHTQEWNLVDLVLFTAINTPESNQKRPLSFIPQSCASGGCTSNVRWLVPASGGGD